MEAVPAQLLSGCAVFGDRVTGVSALCLPVHEIGMQVSVGISKITAVHTRLKAWHRAGPQERMVAVTCVVAALGPRAGKGECRTQGLGFPAPNLHLPASQAPQGPSGVRMLQKQG